MKSVFGGERPWAFGSVLALAVCTLVVGLWGRLYSLSFPPSIMWDEKYFPNMASKYLSGTRFFDLHPPLGKFIIATSIAVFGDDSFGWRFMPAVFGCVLLLLVGILGWYLLRDRVGVAVVVALFAGETILIVHSRTGVMDIFLVFFVLATFLSALWVRRAGQAILPAVLLGLAIGTKWAAFPVAIPVAYILWRKGLLRYFVASLWVSVVLYLLLVYFERLLIVTPNPVQAWVEVWNWHIQAADKIDAAINHAWGSPWWSWPIMLRPIRYYFGVNADAQYQIVLAIGNPLVWWSSTVAVLAGVVELARQAISRKLSLDDPLIPIVMGYVLMLAPWVPGTRIPYIYNYLPIYAFALLALAYWLVRIWRGPAFGPWLVVAFTAAALASTLFFLPLATTFPIDQDGLASRIWTDYWFAFESPVPGSGCLGQNPGELCP